MTATAYSTWGQHPIADNDNVPMVGLTGKRNVGKSTVARLLVEEYGFIGVHAFEGGKQAAKAWFDYFGLDGERMVYGDLKDVPCPDLPHGHAPRYFMERFGQFMGADLGVPWTLEMEIERASKMWPSRPIVVESLVYEAPWFKARGGRVWRLERPGHVGPAGVESDAVQALVVEDVAIRANTVEELKREARRVAQQMVGGS